MRARGQKADPREFTQVTTTVKVRTQRRYAERVNESIRERLDDLPSEVAGVEIVEVKHGQ